MNYERRKELNRIYSELEGLQSRIGELIGGLECVKDDEENAYDCFPENLQNSERGEKMQDNIQALEDAIEQLNEVDSYISEAMGYIEEASE